MPVSVGKSRLRSISNLANQICEFEPSPCETEPYDTDLRQVEVLVHLAQQWKWMANNPNDLAHHPSM